MAKTPPAKRRPSPVADDAAAVVAWLRRRGTKATRQGMARYGMPSGTALGVPVGALQREARRLGRNHALALALWQTGWYEARMMAAYLADPARLTTAQMDGWCRDFDNWGICDTVCFVLFDRSPLAWRRVAPWAKRRDEFQRRAAFALLACLALHDKTAPDARFITCLPLIERGVEDDRNFVAKGVAWALRAIGGRNRALNAEAVALCRRLSSSANAAARSMGTRMLKELTGPAVTTRLTRR
jgi:3-methyladenine DNA glycosylase AlkD